MTNSNCHIAFAVVSVATASVVGWLLIGDSSPANAYFLHHVSLPNAWRTLNFLPYVAASMASNNVHLPSTYWLVGAFLTQWALIGIGVSLAAQKCRKTDEGS
jgi:hypothetical protein